MKTIIKTASGFTLLEILISIAISGLVMVSALKVFENSNESYVVQEDVAQMQQNARMAKYYIERDLRIAGYRIGTIGVGGARLLPFEFENNKNETGFLPNGDVLTMRYLDEDGGACGSKIPSCSDLPQLNLKGTMPAASAEATVFQDLSVAPFSLWDQTCWCGTTEYPPPTPGYPVLITSPDGLKSDIVFVTQVQKTGGDDKLQNHKYLGYDNKVINLYPDGSTIEFFNMDSFITLKYYIDSSYNFRQERNGNNIILAENIEDFQVSFCGDFNFNNKGVPNQADAGDWLNNNDLNTKATAYYNAAVIKANTDGTTVPTIKEANIDAIRFVKISLIARTSREHTSSGIATKRPALEDHTAATTSDYYRRRDISVTVRIRNLGL